MTDLMDDHTLLITTFNRPQFLYRLLRFTAFGLPVGRVLVVDGSQEPYRTQNREVVALFTDRLPIRLDQVAPGISAVEQYRLAITMVDTPFMTLCHDDNFFVHSAVRASVDFLRGHPDYTACSGSEACYTTSRGKLWASVSEIAPLEQDDPLDRLAHFLARHWPADFATWRSQARKRACASLDIYYLDETFGEPLHVGFGALQGKFHVLPQVSIIFCCHESNLNYDARNRQFGPASPNFMRTVDAAAQAVVDFCADLGITAPEDPRLYYLCAYLHWMAFHPVNAFGALGAHLRRRAVEGLAAAQLAALDAPMEAAILQDFLRVSPSDIAAGRSPDPRGDAILFMKAGNMVSLFDNPEVALGNEDRLGATPARSMPAAYETILTALAAGDWSRRYAAFRNRCIASWIAPLAEGRDHEALFAGTFLIALNRMVHPIYLTQSNALDGTLCSEHVAGENNLAKTDPASVAVFLEAARYFQDYPDPSVHDGVAELHARGRRDPQPWDIRHVQMYPELERGMISREFVVSGVDVTTQGTVSFIRLHPDADIVGKIVQGARVWLCVNVEVAAGSLQLALHGRNGLHQLQTVTSRTVRRQFAFSFDGQLYEQLVLLDKTSAPERGYCTLTGWRWVFDTSDGIEGSCGAAAA